MKKLSEYKNRGAIDKLADFIEPLGELMSDPEFAEALRDKNRWKAVSVAAKKHPDAAFAFLAGVDGVPVSEYECGVMALPMRLMEVLGDPDLYTGFISPEAENEPSTSSGSATVNIEGSKN